MHLCVRASRALEVVPLVSDATAEALDGDLAATERRTPAPGDERSWATRTSRRA